MWALLDKGANIVCRLKTAPVLVSQFRIEPVGTAFALEAGQVVELPLAGPLHPAAGQDFSGHYLLGVLLGVLFGALEQPVWARRPYWQVLGADIGCSRQQVR